MGNTNSNMSQNGVFVVLDNYSCHPGDQVTGKVYLNLVQPATVKAVYLKLTGFEKTEWRKCTNHKKAVHREERCPQTGLMMKKIDWVDDWKVEHECGRHDFFKTEIPLGGSIPFGLGQYELPFSVQLPQRLPGSVEVGNPNPKFHAYGLHEDFMWGQCRYKVKAFVETQEAWAGFSATAAPAFGRGAGLRASFGAALGAAAAVHAARKRPQFMKCSQDFQVINRPPPVDAAEAKAEANVNVCCCINKGTAHVAMSSDKDAFQIGDAVSVTASFNNQATVPVNELQLRLKRFVELKSDRGARKYDECSIVEAVKPGCAAGEVCARNFRLQMPNSKALVSSSYGGLLKVYYVLEVKGTVTCASSPKCRIPICIYSRPPVYQRPQITMGWQPQVLPVYVVGAIPGYNAGQVPVFPKQQTTTTTTTTTKKSQPAMMPNDPMTMHAAAQNLPGYGATETTEQTTTTTTTTAQQPQPAVMAPVQMQQAAMMAAPVQGQPMMGQPMMGQPMMGQPMMGQQPMMQQPVPMAQAWGPRA
jgi:hypothetical protein